MKLLMKSTNEMYQTSFVTIHRLFTLLYRNITHIYNSNNLLLIDFMLLPQFMALIQFMVLIQFNI